jgi:hypothetical protein
LITKGQFERLLARVADLDLRHAEAMARLVDAVERSAVLAARLAVLEQIVSNFVDMTEPDAVTNFDGHEHQLQYLNMIARAVLKRGYDGTQEDE